MSEISVTLTISNKLGLHARAAAQLVNTASMFRCNLQIERDGQQVNGKSIMGVMMLAAARGTQITLHLDGEQAQECRDALVELINNKFEEGE